MNIHIAPQSVQSVSNGRVCDGCGQLFKQRRKDARHCKPGCRMVAYSRRQAVRGERVCVGCARTFQARSREQRYCQLSCEPLWDRMTDTAALDTAPERDLVTRRWQAVAYVESDDPGRPE